MAAATTTPSRTGAIHQTTRASDRRSGAVPGHLRDIFGIGDRSYGLGPCRGGCRRRVKRCGPKDESVDTFGLPRLCNYCGWPGMAPREREF